jgi:tetratricopeptide (TPR) repeat protein
MTGVAMRLNRGVAVALALAWSPMATGEPKDQRSMLDLADEAYLLERREEAERYCRGAIEATSGTSADGYACLARTLIAKKRYEEAAEATEREAALRSEPRQKFKALTQLAALRELGGDEEDAELALKEAVSLAREGRVPRAQLVGPLARLAYRAYREGRREDASRLVTEYLDAYEVAGFDPVMIPISTSWLADFYLQMGEDERAEELYRAAVAYYQPPLSGDRKREFLKWVDDYARFLDANGRHTEASALRLEGEKRASN